MPDPIPAPAPAGTTAAQASLAPSLIRTLLPMLAGAVANWLLQRLGLYDVDSTIASGFIVAAFGWIYYAAARFLEVYGSDKWGYILGFRKAPTYVPAGTVAVPPAPGEDGVVDLVGVCIGLIAVGLVALVLALIIHLAWLVTVGAVLLVLGVVGYVLAVIASNRHTRL